MYVSSQDLKLQPKYYYIDVYDSVGSFTLAKWKENTLLIFFRMCLMLMFDIGIELWATGFELSVTIIYLFEEILS